MLLRSSSTPILKSWLLHSGDSSPESDHVRQLSRTRSVCLTTSFLSPPPPSSSDDDLTKKTAVMLLETKMQNPPKHKLKNHGKLSIEELELKPCSNSSPASSHSSQKLFSNSGLGVGVEKDTVLQTQVMGGGVGSSGGRIAGGGGGRGSDGGDGGDGGFGFGFFESNNNNNNHNGSEITDVYYQKMIEANPGNALLLGNYAKFLKEVRCQFAKAEEYCGRAILVNPSDGNVLSLYADLIWLTQRNANRAESYFDRAVKTAPDDCYVLASYARFLWDAEEEDNEDGEEFQHENGHADPSPPKSFPGAPNLPPLTAAT